MLFSKQKRRSNKRERIK